MTANTTTETMLSTLNPNLVFVIDRKRNLVNLISVHLFVSRMVRTYCDS